MSRHRARLARVAHCLSPNKVSKTTSAEDKKTTEPIVLSPTTALSPALVDHSFLRKSGTTSQHETVELSKVEKAWFNRRQSSLCRILASTTAFTEEVRSPRPARCYEYVPLVLGSEATGPTTSEGITVELDDLRKAVLSPDCPDTPTQPSISLLTQTLAAARAGQQAPQPITIKRRPHPIETGHGFWRIQQPSALESFRCIVSETPFSKLFLPDSRRTSRTSCTSRSSRFSIVVRRRESVQTVQTYSTAGSRYIFDWWA